MNVIAEKSVTLAEVKNIFKDKKKEYEDAGKELFYEQKRAYDHASKGCEAWRKRCQKADRRS